MDKKICPSCTKKAGFPVMLPVERFSKNRQMASGYNSYCKACNVEANRQQRRKSTSKPAAMDIPPRQDRIYKGSPGKALQIIHVKGMGW